MRPRSPALAERSSPLPHRAELHRVRRDRSSTDRRGALAEARRTRVEKPPANLTPFLPDEDLEGRRLERVQGWALLFAAVIAVALPLYWLHEPSRQNESDTYFDKNAVERGEVLFSNCRAPSYDPALSLQCANCHGDKGEGGALRDASTAEARWKAPPLNTEVLRFNEDPECRPAERVASPPPSARSRHHHLRPARHTDAGVGRRRRRPEEHPVDPRPRRLHRRSS